MASLRLRDFGLAALACVDGHDATMVAFAESDQSRMGDEDPASDTPCAQLATCDEVVN